MHTLILTLAQHASESAPDPKATSPVTNLILGVVIPLGVLTWLFFVLRKNRKQITTSIQRQEEALHLMKEHHARTEVLLERIAKAVEKNSNPS